MFSQDVRTGFAGDNVLLATQEGKISEQHSDINGKLLREGIRVGLSQKKSPFRERCFSGERTLEETMKDRQRFLQYQNLLTPARCTCHEQDQYAVFIKENEKN